MNPTKSESADWGLILLSGLFAWDRLPLNRGICQLSYSGNIGLIGLMRLNDAHVIGMRPNPGYYRNALVSAVSEGWGGQRDSGHCDRDPLVCLTFTCKQHHPTHRAWETADRQNHTTSLSAANLFIYRKKACVLNPPALRRGTVTQIERSLFTCALHTKQEVDEDLRTMHWFPPVKVFHPGQQYAWWRDPHTFGLRGVIRKSRTFPRKISIMSHSSHFISSVFNHHILASQSKTTHGIKRFF